MAASGVINRGGLTECLENVAGVFNYYKNIGKLNLFSQVLPIT